VAQSFSNFITEEKKETKYKLLVVSTRPNNNPYYHTTQRLMDEAKSRGIEAFALLCETAMVDGINFQVWNSDKKNEKFDIDPDNTIAIIRGSVAGKDAYLDLVSQLEKMGISVVNSRTTVSICADKYRTAIRLNETGVPTPKTSLLQSIETLQDSLDTIGEEYPLILKTLRGSKGIGVIFIESRRQLDSIIQLLWKQDSDTELLLQKYVKTDHDVRVLVLGNKVFASMRRDVLKGDFRSNASLGAKVSEYKLSEEEIKICLDAHKAVNGVYTAVDLIKSGKDSFVLEVNSSPGTSGIEKATGRNLMGEMLDYFKNRDNWRYVAHEIGRLERIEIQGVGDVVANFDTGNSARCIIHTDEYDVKGKEVIWKSYGKTYKHKLVKMGKWERGALNAQVIERPIISFDVMFNGRLYKDVSFALDDRTEKTTKCLMNQDFMSRARVMVNPSRKFVVTESYEDFDIFNDGKTEKERK
jgi:ribosomal protein S6--L-glutamate ligase